MSEPYQKSARWYDKIYTDKAYAAEALTVRGIIERLRPQARTLLEVGCGTGGHLVHFEQWYACEGLDLSEAMLEQARAKTPEVPLCAADMRTFDLQRRFDVVASLFSGIGYVRSVDELQAAVARMAAHVEPGGLLLIEPWFGPDQWKPGQKVHALMVDEPDLKIVRMVLSEQRDRFAITPMHHLIGTLDGVEHFVETHELFLAEPDEYRHAFEAAGLQSVQHIPDVLLRGLWVGRR